MNCPNMYLPAVDQSHICASKVVLQPFMVPRGCIQQTLMILYDFNATMILSTVEQGEEGVDRFQIS